METRLLEDFREIEEESVSEVPEDVAILYSWANLQGETYRDFSQERRKQRAEMRHRAAEQLQRREAKSQEIASQAVLKAPAAQVVADSHNDEAVARGTREPSAHAPLADTDDRAVDVSRAEVVKRISPALSGCAPVGLREATPGPASGDSSLFEVTEHAISELFEAEPLGATDSSRADSAAEAQSSSKRLAKSGTDVPGPAWLYPKQHASGMRSLAIVHASGDAPESLDHSKERIAARWFALRSVFARHDVDRSSERVASKEKERQAPIVAVFSIAGGAGKTSLVATLGRALSFLGERVLLSDTTSHGLLPFYFGASQLVPGVVRTFTPPAGSTDAPIHLVSYDMNRDGDEEEGRAGILDNLLENSRRANRVLLDLGANAAKMVGRLGQFKPTILIPLMPDMNSVISIDGVEKLFGSMLDADGRPLQPFYLLNQFDASLPLHLDIREVLKQQLGERLLPFVIRRSAAVGEALAEGMTIVDYDPGSSVAEDYLRATNWLRSVSAPVAVGFRSQRWSEQ